MRHAGQHDRLDAVVARGRAHVVRRADPVALGAQHHQVRAVALGPEPVEAQRQVEDRARGFGREVVRGGREDRGIDAVAEIEGPERLEHVRRQPRRIEPDHVGEVVGALDGEPRGDRHEAGGRDRREQRRGAHRVHREHALDDRRAHRVPDQDRRLAERTGGALHVRRVVVEAGREQRLRAAAAAVPAQRKRVGGPSARREPRQEVRRPAPAVRVAAVHEQERRTAGARRGLARPGLEVRFEGEHVLLLTA